MKKYNSVIFLSVCITTLYANALIYITVLYRRHTTVLKQKLLYPSTKKYSIVSWGGSMSYVSAAKIKDVKEGEGKTVSVNGQEVALFNVEGKFHAIDNSCVHKGGPLGEGMLEGDVVTCPWHGWKYNVKTGVSPVKSSVSVKAFKTKVVGDEIQVEV